MESHIMNGTKFKCYSCLEKASHSVKSIQNTFSPIDDSYFTEFLLKVCDHCGYNSYATMTYEAFGEGEKVIQVYPSDADIVIKELKQKFELTALESSVESLFNQIIQAYANDSLVLATVGLRVLLEEYIRIVGIEGQCEIKVNSAEDREIKESLGNENLESVLDPDVQMEFSTTRRKNLNTQINNLYKERYINRLQMFAFHKIRIYGNDAAHEAKEISKGMFMVMFESIYQIFRTRQLIEGDYNMQVFLSYL